MGTICHEGLSITSIQEGSMIQPSLDLSGYHSPLNIAESLRMRDEGISRVMENSGEWKHEALAELKKIWLDRRYEDNEFTFEMLKFPVIKAVGAPHSTSVWGGIAREMRKRGWIREVGTGTAQSVSRHASLVRIYKWGSA